MASNLEELYKVAGNIKCEQRVFLEHREIEQEVELLLSALLLGARLSEQDLYLVVVSGGTGVGKSTFLNWLLGEELCEASSVRPCTSHPQFLVHVSRHSQVLEVLDTYQEVLSEVSLKTHSQDSVKNVILVDSPDYDSTESAHLRIARLLLEASHKVIVVLSPAKYGDLAATKWYSSARRSSRDLIPVLNKIDTLDPRGLEELSHSCARLLEVETRRLHKVSSVSSGKGRDEILSSVGSDAKTNGILSLFTSQLASFRTQLEKQILCMDEVYGKRSFGLEQTQARVDEVHSKFWDRHKLLRKDIETDLKTRLGKIAEQKVFYFSKWITKHLFSFVDQIQSSLGFSGAKDQDQLPGDKLSYQDQIFRNLEVSIVQSHGILLEASRKYDWIPEPEGLEMESIKSRFREEFENFQQSIYEQISKSFESNVTTRHSILAVSQEVLLSLLFYSFLGPIGFIPGSEQVLSGLCYLVYGKLPSAKLPSVMMELENLSKDCHNQFEAFLRDYLEKPCLKFESHRAQTQDLKIQWIRLRDELSSI